MYPLGHNVSDTSSTGITNGESEEDVDENDAPVLQMIFENKVLDLVVVVVVVMAAVLEPIALSE